MSACFGAVPATPTHYYCSSSGRRPWRWWRAKCAAIAAAVGSRLRRSVVKRVDARRGRRCRRAASPSVWCHHHHQHRWSFPPVYVDELYGDHHHHHQQHRPAAAKALRVVARREDGPTTASSDVAKLTAAAAAPPLAHAGTPRATGIKATARVGAADARRSVPARVGADAARAGGAVAVATAAGAVRNVLLRSPGRGGGGVVGVVKGMGEVDLRAELFIRKFKEDMRLQTQRSADELHAMLARGL